MWVSKRALVTVLAATIGVSSMVFAGGAFGALGASHRGNLNHRGGESLIEESLAPSHVSDPVFHGVSPGSLPWALKQGDVRLERSGRDGRLELQVMGLVIPSMGTPGPVTTSYRTRPPVTTWRVQVTGAACTRLEVNTAAAAREGPSFRTTATSGWPDCFSPAATPAARKPSGAVTLMELLRGGSGRRSPAGRA